MAFGKGSLFIRPILLCEAWHSDSACDAIVLVLVSLTWLGHTVFTSPEQDGDTDHLGSLPSCGSLWSNDHRNNPLTKPLTMAGLDDEEESDDKVTPAPQNSFLT